MCAVINIVQKMNCICNNWFVAFSTKISKQLSIMCFAIRFVVLFIKIGCGKGFVTNESNKMFWMPQTTKGSDGTTQNWFVARCANISKQFFVTFAIIKISFVFMRIGSSQFFSAFFATEMFRMHFHSIQRNEIAHNWSFAFSAWFAWRNFSCCIFCFASHAKYVFLFNAVFLTHQIFAASCACEMIGMKHFVSCINAFVYDWLIASETFGTKQFGVMWFAIRFAIVFNECSVGKFLIAFGTNETFWMKCFSNGIHALTNYHFSTRCTRRSRMNDWSSIWSFSCKSTRSTSTRTRST